MTTTLQAYLHFNGNARTAMEFYKTIFGGELTISSFKENGLSKDPSQDELVMHSVLKSSDSFTFMGSDAMNAVTERLDKNISMCINGADKAYLTKVFEQLAEGGNTSVSLSESSWGGMFGMVTDKFGIEWMVNIEAA